MLERLIDLAVRRRIATLVLTVGFVVFGVHTFSKLKVQAFPDVKIQVEDAMTDGDRVMRRVSWTGTYYGTYLGLAASGRAVRGEGIDSFR